MAQAANVQQVYISGADDRADGGAAIGAAQGAAAAAPRGWSDAFDELMSVRPPLSAKQKSDVLQMVALQRLAPSEEEKRCKIMDRLLTIENYWPGPPASAECSSESEPEEIEAKPKLKKRRPAPAPAPAAAGGAWRSLLPQARRAGPRQRPSSQTSRQSQRNRREAIAPSPPPSPRECGQ